MKLWRSTPKQLDLRCYLRSLPNEKWQGVCLTLNLVVEADSCEQAEKKLDSLILAYVTDAIENNEVDAFIPRRAPLTFYAEYLLPSYRVSLRYRMRVVAVDKS